MGKKKGKDKNKLAKMSEEERQRYLQHRADMEEEAKRRKQQLIATFMKNKLKKEDAFTRINMAKINSEWRDLLRKLKCTELCSELMSVKKDCDENIQRKNSVIQRLLCDLDESEEIYSTMLNSHSNIIERLIELHSDRLEFFQRGYNVEKQRLLQVYRKDMADYKSKKFQMQKELESIYYGLSERTFKTIKSAEEEFMQKVDELKNSMMLKLENITKERELHMEKLWKEFQSVLNSYLKYIEEYRDEYIDLRNRDAEDTRSIQDHYSEVSKLTDKIVELKSQLANVKDEQDFNINQLIKHKTDLKLRMDKIKEDMENGLINDKEKLKSLAFNGSKKINKLQANLKQGHNIIQLIRLCEGLEHDQQKPTTKRMFLEYTEEEMKKPPPESEISEMYGNLDNFWMQFNRTKIDCVCLQEEKSMLKSQNKALKNKLKHYLITLNMTSGQQASSKNDERFTKRPGSMKVEKIEKVYISSKNQLIMKGKMQRRPVTCIEGNLSNAVRHMKLVGLI